MDYKITVKRDKDIYKLDFNEFIKGKWLEVIKEESKKYESIEVEYSNGVLAIRKAKKIKEENK